MRQCALALVSALILCVPGCYGSDVPLASSEKSTIEPELLGNWFHVVEPTDDQAESFIPEKPTRDQVESFAHVTSTGARAKLFVLLKIMKFNDHEYFACWQEPDDTSLLPVRAYSVTVGETKILNVKSIRADVEETVFWFFKYEVTDKGRLVLQMMNGGSPLLKGKKFKTSEEFMAFVKEHLTDETLFGKPVEFTRTTAELELHMTVKKD